MLTSNKKKIAIVVAHFDESLDYFETTLAHQLSRKHQVHVVTTPLRSRTLLDVGHRDLPPRSAGTAHERGVTIHRLPPLFRQGQRVVAKNVAQTLGRIQPDLIVQIVPSQFFSIPATRFAALNQIPLVYISGENHQQGPQSGIGSFTKRIYLESVVRVVMYYTVSRATRVIATTSETANLIQAYVPHTTPEVIPLPFRSDRFFYDVKLRDETRAHFGVERGHLTVFIGRPSPQKRLERLVSAWECAASSNPHMYLLLGGLGQDHYSEFIRSTVAASLYASRIRLISFVGFERVNALLNAADVTLWPHVSVGIQQAMATGALVLLPHDSPGEPLLREKSEVMGHTYVNGDDSNAPESLARQLQAPMVTGHQARRRRAAAARSIYSDQVIVSRIVGGLID